MDVLLPQVRIVQTTAEVDPQALFPGQEVWLEIGFGGGEHLRDMALANPGVGFIGCEPFVNGVASLLQHVSDADISNVRIWDHDARYFLEHLKPQSIGRVFVLFPDPWRKARHHRRRLVQRETLEKIHRILKPGGQLRMASDDPSYLEWMDDVLANAVDLFQRDPDHNDRNQPLDWPKTRYQEKAERENRVSRFFILNRV